VLSDYAQLPGWFSPGNKVSSSYRTPGMKKKITWQVAMHVSISRCMESTPSLMSCCASTLCIMFSSAHLKTLLWILSNVLQQSCSRLNDRQQHRWNLRLRLVDCINSWHVTVRLGHALHQCIGQEIASPSQISASTLHTGLKTDLSHEWEEVAYLINFNVLYTDPDILHWISWSSAISIGSASVSQTHPHQQPWQMDRHSFSWKRWVKSRGLLWWCSLQLAYLLSPFLFRIHQHHLPWASPHKLC
jgi:hypothetical protein